MSRWAADVVGVMREQGKTDAPPQILLAEVQSVKPLKLKLKDTIVEKNIYLPEELLYKADPADAIDKCFIGHHEPDQLFEFLLEWHNQAKLKPGDLLAVIQSGVSFVVLSKVVKVS